MYVPQKLGFQVFLKLYFLERSKYRTVPPISPDLTSNPFCYTKILAYEIQLPPSGKEVGFNLLDDKYFTIPYVPDTIPNSPDGHQLPTQAKKIGDHCYKWRTFYKIQFLEHLRNQFFGVRTLM